MQCVSSEHKSKKEFFVGTSEKLPTKNPRKFTKVQQKTLFRGRTSHEKHRYQTKHLAWKEFQQNTLHPRLYWRKPSFETWIRPYSYWHHLALGLCLDNDTDIAAISSRSFYSNIDSVSSKNHEYCSTFQALDDYYLNNTSLYKFDRGHLLVGFLTLVIVRQLLMVQND